MWLPIVSADVENAACPPLSVRVPRIVVPSLKVTAPIGTPPLEVTVAVNVTFAPKADGFAEDESTVVVVAWITTWEMEVDVLVAKFPAPAYTALIEWVPKLRVEVVNTAFPPLIVRLPITELPSRNVTVPAGEP